MPCLLSGNNNAAIQPFIRPLQSPLNYHCVSSLVFFLTTPLRLHGGSLTTTRAPLLRYLTPSSAMAGRKNKNRKTSRMSSPDSNDDAASTKTVQDAVATRRAELRNQVAVWERSLRFDCLPEQTTLVNVINELLKLDVKFEPSDDDNERKQTEACYARLDRIKERLALQHVDPKSSSQSVDTSAAASGPAPYDRPPQEQLRAFDGTNFELFWSAFEDLVLRHKDLDQRAKLRMLKYNLKLQEDLELLGDLGPCNPDLNEAASRLKAKYRSSAMTELKLRDQAQKAPKLLFVPSAKDWDTFLNLCRSIEVQSKQFGDHFQKQLTSTLYSKLTPQQRDKFREHKSDNLEALCRFAQDRLEDARLDATLRANSFGTPHTNVVGVDFHSVDELNVCAEEEEDLFYDAETGYVDQEEEDEYFDAKDDEEILILTTVDGK